MIKIDDKKFKEILKIMSDKLGALELARVLEADSETHFTLSQKITALKEKIISFNKEYFDGETQTRSDNEGMSEFKFFNRENERYSINMLHDSFLYISAPPCYGKTYLLKKLKEERVSQEDGWHVAFFSVFDLPRLSDDPKDGSKEIVRFINRILGFGLFNSLGGHDRQSKILILIDDVHVVIEKQYQNTSKALLNFLNELRQLPLDPKVFQIILAGRYIDSHHIKLNFPLINFRKIKLGEFTQKDIHLMLDKSCTSHGIKLIDSENKRKLFHNLAGDIESLSCGHPQAIVNLIEDLLGKIDGSQPLPSIDIITANEQQLFETHVTPLLEKMLSVLSEESKELLEILSVFNSFNIGTISFLEKQGFVKAVSPEKTLRRLEQLGNICSKSIEVYGFYHDAILIDLLRKDLRLKNERRYQEINDCATEYSELLFNENTLEAKEYFGKQFVYHAIQTGDKQVYINSLKKYSTYFKEHHGALSAEQLKNYFSDSDETDRISNRVNKTILRFLQENDWLLDTLNLNKENLDG
jgi:hypothetical protein